MNDTLLLVGSLSNDLFRVATLAQRGSTRSAVRFLHEAKRWSVPLENAAEARYIRKIAAEVSLQTDEISMELAERYLMYGVLLQNYALHFPHKKHKTTASR